MTLWFRDETAGEARLRELLESGWVGTMRNDGPIWKVRVVRPVAKTPPDEAPEL
ncbi:MAG: hypothetical protein AMXMBFR82_48980 [Candidatus Hydrogenedentota bacterium]